MHNMIPEKLQMINVKHEPEIWTRSQKYFTYLALTAKWQADYYEFLWKRTVIWFMGSINLGETSLWLLEL